MLYIVYWGALEPLGRALVLPTVKRLAALGARITLVTFDKPADLARADDLRSAAESLHQAGVRWLPLRYHKHPRVPATMLDLSHGVARGIVERIRDRPDIVHARTFLGGLIGVGVARLTGTRLIYQNEGFYPDEQVDGGVWQAGSPPHRLARRLEQYLYKKADGIFSTSSGGKAIIESFERVRDKQTPVVVVPSSVDLERFRPQPQPAPRHDDSLSLVYVGSVGKRYQLDHVGRFVYIAADTHPGTHLDVISHSEPDLIKAMLDASGLPDEAWSSKFVPHAQMPNALANHDAGFFFLTQGLSTVGFSPTKVGEYWAMGMPVISTPGMADIDEIIRRERVGVIVEEHTDEAYRAALKRLVDLLDDPELTDRCRRAAEKHYSLDTACKSQIEVYRQLASGERRPR